MRAIWSFWSKPFKTHHRLTWMSEKHHLFTWVLSTETARQHYPETSLITDDEGVKILIEGIGLEFNYVSTELNALERSDPGWWALGKIYAYRAQREPFIHIDNDVFLWKPLPKRMEYAPVFAQNPEHFSSGFSCYRPEDFEFVIKCVNGWIPEEWVWYRSAGHAQRGECCGVVGGNRVDFINYYAELAIRLIEHPLNQPAWSHLADKMGNNILFEQYLLAACIEYHKSRPSSPYRDLDIEYMFNSWDDAHIPDNAAQAGYTHLIGGAKRNPVIAERLERRVMRDYPDYYERCVRYAEKIGVGEGTES